MRKLFFGLFLFAMLVGTLFLAACGANDMTAEAPMVAPVATPAPAMAEAVEARYRMAMTDAAPAQEWAGDAAVATEQADFVAVDNYGYGAIGIIAAASEAAAPRMLIQRATLVMSTDEFDRAMDNLRNAPASFGGYVESSNLGQDWSHDFEVHGWTRTFWITMRVPVARFEAALRHVEGYGEVATLNQTTDDVTGQFTDFRRRMEVRLVEEDRLLALVDQATTLQQIFTLEDRLTQVRHHIEFYRGAMEGLGDQAAFSTISVQLWELVELEEDEEEEEEGYTFGQRVSSTFNTSVRVVSAALQGFVVFMAGAIIPLLVLGAIAVPIVILARFLAKRAREKAAANPPMPHYSHYAPYPPSYPGYPAQPVEPPAVETPEAGSEATQAEKGKDETSEE